MADVLEMRYYLPKFSLEHLHAGVQPTKMPTGPGTFDYFAPPLLQYRVRRTVMVDGNKAHEWSEWKGVMWVREGDAPPPSNVENPSPSNG